METTLHRQLKAIYADDERRQEVTVDGYRIDALQDGRLVEIQYGSLAAIRDKVADLLTRHDVHVVKPLAARKYLIKRKRKGGKIVSARYSPARASLFHIFDELVYFVNVFPHVRLTLEILLAEVEEHRLPPARSRRWRKTFRVEDRVLRSIKNRVLLKTTDDLVTLLPSDLPEPFTTLELATAAEIPRWLAQKTAYCLRQTGAARTVGKRGNAWLYEKPRLDRLKPVA